jgi:hypothetical protein
MIHEAGVRGEERGGKDCGNTRFTCMWLERHKARHGRPQASKHDTPTQDRVSITLRCKTKNQFTCSGRPRGHPWLRKPAAVYSKHGHLSAELFYPFGPKPQKNAPNLQCLAGVLWLAIHTSTLRITHCLRRVCSLPGHSGRNSSGLEVEEMYSIDR